MTNEEFLKQLKIINDSTRLEIIQMLVKNGTMCACKILEELKITQGTLSHHMKLMTSAGLVTCKKEGKWCHYTIVKHKIKEIGNFFEGLNDICSINDSCDFK